MEATVQNPGKLASLPFEVLSHILTHVDGSDIPALKLTCKTILSAMMTRQFWYNRIDRLCKEHLVFPPEEELEEYTIAELEKWCFRRIWARCVLPTKLQCRSRNLGAASESSSNSLLIPGGRWLLMIGAKGPVYFCDLDSNDLDRYILIHPSQLEPCISKCRYIGLYRLWIDHSAPRLSFRLSISFDFKDDGLNFCRVCIFQVNLVGHGASATLVAKTIAAFRSPKEVRPPRCIAFNDRYFILMHPPQSLDAKIVILDYSRTLGCLDYSLINSHTLPAERGAWKMKVISGNILVVLYRQSLSSYTLNIESSTPIQPLHKIKFSMGLDNFSRTCWTPKASLITVTQQSNLKTPNNDCATVHGVVIPHDSRLHPWTVKLGDILGTSADVMLGIFISFVCYEGSRVVRHGHEWDITSPCGNRVPAWSLTQAVDLPQIDKFDEDTGRSIHFTYNGMNVIDMVNL